MLLREKIIYSEPSKKGTVLNKLQKYGTTHAIWILEHQKLNVCASMFAACFGTLPVITPVHGHPKNKH